MPKRIQRKRSKGWKMPDGAVYVGRPTKWGNPFSTASNYRWWLEQPQPQGNPPYDPARDRILADIEELRGKDLACWCKPGESCHADVLLEMANK